MGGRAMTPDETLMAKAVSEFFISGYDPVGQHKAPADLAFSMQFELDLLAEGYELRRMKAGRK